MSVSLFAGAVVALATQAAPAAPTPAPAVEAASPSLGREVVRVALDAARPLALRSAASGVVIGNPMIAGVTVQNERLLFVTGKSYGSTNMIVVNEAGQPLFEGRITVVPDETDAVMLINGDEAMRYDCAPICRRRPDLSDSPGAFNEITALIGARGGE